ncbi:glycoside hydrolase family 113 [Tamlana crocina]|uniref:Glycoside hydrolase n=1 Tax=Tamlana crocina TaxID=393006 RepID=A0ABX1DCR3_9FLAO|nr:glycoside hydrolase TIM-barrel-like domain-containing protein [Tamlana crocina]NJX14864.1 glycoside hydrolase [Tamlana crocina]
MKTYKLLILLLLLQSCTAQVEKINGVSFVASRNAVNEKHVSPVVKLNANYAAVMPFGFVKSLNSTTLTYNTNKQWFGETAKGVKQYVETLQKHHIKIMIKPQIWVWHGEFTGFIKMTSEENWKAFETSYSKFILEYAALAEEVNADIFCIGTELETFIKNRPNFWFQLIKKIKTVYKGKLTYAANWDEFKRTPFWGELDFIGIDAYFPVSDVKTPTFEDAMEGWKNHLPEIKAKQKAFNKPVLFTEFGYRSVDFSGKEPWKSERSMQGVNLEAQVNTTKALFETFWHQDWFAGGFVWKWFINHEQVGGEQNHMFTPQNKPVEKIIKSYYEAFK